MKKIISGLFIIEDIGSANIFLIGNQDHFSLIDSGIFMKTKYLIEELKVNGFDLSKLNKIVLTHCHCDHIGGVKELSDKSNAEVAAHVDDIPYILQEKIIEGPYNKMMIEEQKTMKRLNCVVPQVDIGLKNGDILDLMGGLEVINVPGHTPGSIALYQKDKMIMFFGDVIRRNKKKSLTIGIPEYFNVNTEQLKKDAKKLLSYEIKYGLLSHGDLILENEFEYLKSIV